MPDGQSFRKPNSKSEHHDAGGEGGFAGWLTLIPLLQFLLVKVSGLLEFSKLLLGELGLTSKRYVSLERLHCEGTRGIQSSSVASWPPGPREAEREGEGGREALVCGWDELSQSRDGIDGVDDKDVQDG